MVAHGHGLENSFMLPIDKRKFYSDPSNKPVMLPVIPDGIPEELRRERRWMLWNLELKTGRWSKVPKQVNGRDASSTDPAKWNTFNAVNTAYAKGSGDGLGFALGDGFAGIDLDNCRNPETGEISPWAQTIIDDFGSYAEVSPSRTGVKIIGRGTWTAKWHKKLAPNGGEIEVYDSGRYFTITGDRLNTHGIGDIGLMLVLLALEYGERPKLPRIDTPAASQPLEDDAVIAKAMNAKNGSKFRRLWDGDTSDHSADESRADLALCGTLAFYTGPDEARIDRLFRQSGLMRAKWDEPRKQSTYGRDTITKALGGRTEFYLPSGKGKAEVKTANSAENADDWPAPVPLVVLPDVPAFPSQVLPTWMREFVEALAVELQVPLDLPGILVLAAAAAGIGRKVAVSPRPGWKDEPTNIFAMVGLPPGEKKSQTFKKCLAPVLEYERELQERELPNIERAESEFKVAELRVQHLQGKLAKAECATDRPPLKEELARALEERQAVQVPAMPHLQVDDDTPEKLAQELANQNGRLLVASPEARALENISMYGEKPNFDVFLKGHAGDDMKSGRISRGRQAVTKPALTCVFTPQPHVLETLGETEALRGRGFLARWFYSLPVSRVGYRDVDPSPMGEQTEASYRQCMKTLWLSEYATNDDPPEAHNLTFCPEALRMLNDFLRWIEAELRPGGMLADLAGWGNKLGGLFVRLCGVLHVAGTLFPGAPWRRMPISAATAQAALTLARDYAVPHARAAFALMGEDVKVGFAKKVLKWLKARNEPQADFSKRDCFNGCRGTFENVDELQPVLDLLERHYLIRSNETARKVGPGRNPSTKYEVNPAAWHDEPLAQNPHYSQNSSA